ncbi:hypothetical protein EOD39_2541 [Acipenser ruthenus]|uniref:Uncharacterized protein n=1 Tax=Acipenser ruthenus TaxID=7906 RepID=A0A444U0I6_ACIRT|nr:hypothetical protein EOD39_2541 [Acipenser ruthenus]
MQRRRIRPFPEADDSTSATETRVLTSSAPPPAALSPPHAPVAIGAQDCMTSPTVPGKADAVEVLWQRSKEGLSEPAGPAMGATEGVPGHLLCERGGLWVHWNRCTASSDEEIPINGPQINLTNTNSSSPIIAQNMNVIVLQEFDEAPFKYQALLN